MINKQPLLKIEGLRVEFQLRQGTAAVINDLNIELGHGETLGIVGESGCGKSITALSVMGLVPSPPGRVSAGSIFLEGEDLLQAGPKRMRQIRGNDISMIFQEPMTSLNPVYKVGDQIAETVRIHQGLSKQDAFGRAIEMLKAVDIPAPRRRAEEYPYQLSGGMRQRVMIAMALACNPKILIADEPTTALDVTVQAQIFDLLREIQTRTGASILFITHDMGSIAAMADRVAVMYAGRKMEEGPVNQILTRPKHPYTKGLISCVPHLEKDPPEVRQPLCEIAGVVPSLMNRARGCPFAPRCDYSMPRCHEGDAPPIFEDAENGEAACWLLETGRPAEASAIEVKTAEEDQAGPDVPKYQDTKNYLVHVKDLKIHFQRRRRLFKPKSTVKAVDGVSFSIPRGKTFGLVGESGSGKTTTALGLMRLAPITDGRIVLDGEDITFLQGEALRYLRRRIQLIFQDPYSSLNPHQRAGHIVREPMELLHVEDKKNYQNRVDELFDNVGLRREQQAYFPHQFSGGQRQRIGVARALASRPDLIVCDEPVSALDVAIQAQIINLLRNLQSEFGLTFLFISHDLGVVQYVCDEIAVMYLGRIVEQADRLSLFRNPLHPYTLSLLSAVPSAKPSDIKSKRRIRLTGDPPSPIDPPEGCRFVSRCPYTGKDEECREVTPMLREINGGRKVACHKITSNEEAPWLTNGEF